MGSVGKKPGFVVLSSFMTEFPCSEKSPTTEKVCGDLEEARQYCSNNFVRGPFLELVCLLCTRVVHMFLLFPARCCPSNTLCVFLEMQGGFALSTRE